MGSEGLTVCTPGIEVRLQRREGDSVCVPVLCRLDPHTRIMRKPCKTTTEKR